MVQHSSISHTGIPGAIVVQDDGSTVGTASVINFTNGTATYAGGTATVALDSGGGGSGNLAGTELDYAQITSTVTITATSEATAGTAITGGTVTVNGSTVVLVEVYSPFIQADAAVAGRSLSVYLFDGSASLGVLSYSETHVAGRTNYLPFSASRRLTPSNGDHVYSVRASCSAGTAQFGAGAGGTANANMPAFLRVTRVSS